MSNSAGISTTGDMSDALVAQSVGGSGGKGGFAIAGDVNLGDGASVEVALGGGGGDGAQGAAVNVDASAGEIEAIGDGSRGIVAQSIGGGGGNGGMAITGSFTDSEKSKDFQLSIGGIAGDGNAGSQVTITHGGTIVTGTDADFDPARAAAQAGGHGILAQSIGGGGGNGGLSVSGSRNEGNRSLTVGIGGGGASGARGELVSVTNTGSVSTNGVHSDGILAQSIGGGGGSGAGALAFNSANDESKALNLSVGGTGGEGAVGGPTTVDISGTSAQVSASGFGSRGVVAQSIGGGGGNGGSNSYITEEGITSPHQLSVGIGGAGGSGSDGGTVNVTMSGGAVSTGFGEGNPDNEGSSYEGHAIFAQSVGGGGGSGGAALSGVSTSDQDETAAFGIGGTGKGGGAGGEVNVGSEDTAITGTITTSNYSSHGIFVQSVGGGGGSGGVGISGDVDNGGKNGLVAGLGGSGGAGGIGRSVSVNSAADVTVKGAGSKGIMAQSVGGGGGAGNIGIEGDVTSGSDDESSKQITFGLGGTGGSGGAALSAFVTNSGGIETGELSSSATRTAMDAIFAQSVGGGGGSGGVGIKGDLNSTGKARNFELTLGIGADGGSGGLGGEAFVENTGELLARGDGARGIFAQSVGGAGGDGSAGIVGDLNASKNENSTADTQVDVALGGKGGGGGDSGFVTVTNTNKITIERLVDGGDIANAAGIFAQSVGGGGGNAGVGLQGDITGAKNSKAASLLLGAEGGGGGDAAQGDVSSFGDAGVGVSNSATIAVTGDAGRGIHAQSVGGGGGNGGMGLNGKVDSGDGKAVTFALGQSGGPGGQGGDVVIENTGTVTTGETSNTSNRTLSDAFALFGQSVGGGGGSGFLTGGLVYGSTGDGTNRGVDFALGGGSAENANAGQDGGEVVLSNSGALTTYYAGSHALFAQSVGGGGGHAGTIGGIGADETDENWAATVAVGGGGSSGDGGDASAYLVSEDSGVTTLGSGSHGVVVQSVGGGGGTAANAAGQGGATSAYSTDNAKVAITLGGSSGTSGDGGAILVSGGAADETTGVTPAGDGAIQTSGSHAIGILAQSVGGGGGTAGEGLQTSVSGSSVTLGADDAAPSGDGGIVEVFFEGSVETEGQSAIGILAQSAGGGGGYAGFVQLRDSTVWGVGQNLAMGGSGSQSGAGGEALVILEEGASISTKGDDAVGILAQSVAGGGGIQGSTGSGLNASVGSAGGSGAPGSAAVELTGATVTTEGAWAHGIFLQAADNSEEPGGSTFTTVNVGTGSSVTTSGTGASGIIAQRAGRSGVQTVGVSVTVEEGASVTGGLGSIGEAEGRTAAVWVLDGTSANTITNDGTISTADVQEVGNKPEFKGVAIKYTGTAGLTVDNNGTINGSVQRSAATAAPALAAAAAPAPTQANGTTQLINRESGTLVSDGVSTFDRIINFGTVDVAGAGNAGTIFHEGALFENKASGVVLFDLLTDESELGVNDSITSSGIISLDFGSTLQLNATNAFKFEVGTVFDLLVADDLIFETENDPNFDLFDYVSAPSLDLSRWDLSLTTGFDMFSAGPKSAVAVAQASFETLRLTLVAPIPVPASIIFYGSGLLFVVGLARGSRRGRKSRSVN